MSKQGSKGSIGAKAPAPLRSTGRMTLSYGLVTVPVKVYSGLSDIRVKRHRFTQDGHEVGMKNYDKETGEDVEYGDIVMKVETTNGPVEVSDEEIAAAVGGFDGVANILGVVPLSMFSYYRPTDLLQVRPDYGTSKKAIPTIDKAFMLLMQVLEARQQFALIEFTLRGTPRYAGLTADGYLHVFAYADAVREAMPMPQVDISPEEFAMASQLVHTMESAEYIEVTNTAAAKVQDYAETKAAGEAPLVTKKVNTGGDDLMAALKASIAESKAKQELNV